jgi:hypothetical protein
MGTVSATIHFSVQNDSRSNTRANCNPDEAAFSPAHSPSRFAQRSSVCIVFESSGHSKHIGKIGDGIPPYPARKRIHISKFAGNRVGWSRTPDAYSGEHNSRLLHLPIENLNDVCQGALGTIFYADRSICPNQDRAGLVHNANRDLCAPDVDSGYGAFSSVPHRVGYCHLSTSAS